MGVAVEIKFDHQWADGVGNSYDVKAFPRNVE